MSEQPKPGRSAGGSLRPGYRRLVEAADAMDPGQTLHVKASTRWTRAQAVRIRQNLYRLLGKRGKEFRTFTIPGRAGFFVARIPSAHITIDGL